MDFDLVPFRPTVIDLPAGWYDVSLTGELGDVRHAAIKLDFGRSLCAFDSAELWNVAGIWQSRLRVYRPARAMELILHPTEALREYRLSFARQSMGVIATRRICFLAAALMSPSKLLSRADPYEIGYWPLFERGLVAFPPVQGFRSRYEEWQLRHEILRPMKVKAAGPQMQVVKQSDQPVDLSMFDSNWSGSRDWIVFVDQGAELSSNALIALSEVAKEEGRLCLYGDNDSIARSGRRNLPEMRLGFSVDRLAVDDCLGPVIAFRRDLLASLPVAFRTLRWLEFRRLAVLSVAKQHGEAAIGHVPEILAHRSMFDLAKRRNSHAPVPLRTSASPTESPAVSIIMLTKDRAALLSAAVRSILEVDCGCTFELIIVDHESVEMETHQLLDQLVSDQLAKVFKVSGCFNYSAFNNEAAKLASNEVLLFLNNDVEAMVPGWLGAMARAANNDAIGCVGALLTYPDGSVQHDGITLGIGGVAGHAQRGFDPICPPRRSALQTIRSVSAVTGACLALRKHLFQTLGGFDALNLPVAFNDVDLCLRARERGLRNLWLPEARLIHHESATRSEDSLDHPDDRFRNEVAYMRRKWGRLLDSDTYYSPNFSLKKSGLELRL
jgi:glycosyltransferase involved in cell wall biosynthesis